MPSDEPVTVYHVDDAGKTPIMMPRWVYEDLKLKLREYENDDEATAYITHYAVSMATNLLGRFQANQ